jgi:hypothetical protein
VEEIGRVPHVRTSVHPDFSVKFPGVDELRAAFLDESRTRILWWRLVQEIRDHGPKRQAKPNNRFCLPGQTYSKIDTGQEISSAGNS